MEAAVAAGVPFGSEKKPEITISSSQVDSDHEAPENEKIPS
jgi:hypothetical protein